MRILVSILGVVCGCLAAAAVLLAGGAGLLQARISLPVNAPSTLIVDGFAGRGIVEHPSALLGFGDPEGGGFADTGLKHVRVGVGRLDSAEPGAPALAVKISAPARDNSLLHGRLSMQSAWNVVWPGHGSIFLTGRDNYRPLLADMSLNLLTGDGFALSAQSHPLSENARLYGAGGRLLTAEGSYREYVSPVSSGELELGLGEN